MSIAAKVQKRLDKELQDANVLLSQERQRTAAMAALARRAPTIIPAVLLLLVAGWQAIRIETHDQSPWAGGGFSMFAFVDGDQYRRIIAVDADEPTISSISGRSTLAGAPRGQSKVGSTAHR